MSKRHFIGIGIAIACVSLACLCCPASILPLAQVPSPVPATQTLLLQPVTPTSFPSLEPTFTFTPRPTTGISLDCTQQLEKLLRQSEDDSYNGPRLNHAFTLVTYRVSGNMIEDPVFARQVPEKVLADQQDLSGQQRIWDFFADIIPADQRSLVTNFVIFTDGVNQALGAVEPAADPHDWMLEMDIEDARDFPVMSTTLVHEYGHLLTLNDSQVPVDYLISQYSGEHPTKDKGSSSCSTYLSSEGCSLPDSYLNRFFQRFWPDIYAEWQAIASQNNSDPDTLDQEWHAFYHRYASQFVSGYAATSPEEDIAEFFMYFIFMEKPSGADVAEQKYLFFYDYPDLVNLRDQILVGLCPYADAQ